MPASSGREFLILKAGTAIAGLRENSLSVDGSPVDVTDKDDGGYRTLASFAGSKSFEISASGVLKDEILRDIALGTGSLLLTDITVEFDDGDVITGDVYLASAEFAGAYDGENTYTVALQSSGAWTAPTAPGP
jgi:predicted secreted protein